MDYDLTTDAQIVIPVLAGFTPLYAGIPDPARGRRMVQQLEGPGLGVSPERDGFPAPSFDRAVEGSSPRRYWRGPVWIQMKST